MDGAARRHQIVEAVIPLFSHTGFGGVTTKEIAAAAGVSEGLLSGTFRPRRRSIRKFFNSGAYSIPISCGWRRCRRQQTP
ncbi:MAG: helix-turn-helix domain-containing protein [Rhodospirillaceae bacterium]